jgi:hypothetical protein
MSGTTSWTETIYDTETSDIEHYANWQIEDKPVKGTYSSAKKTISYYSIDDLTSPLFPVEITETTDGNGTYTLVSGPWPDLPYPDDPALIRSFGQYTRITTGYTAERVGVMEDEGFKVMVYNVTQVEAREYSMEDVTMYLALSMGGVDYYQVSLNDSAFETTYEAYITAYINIDGTDYGYTDTSGVLGEKYGVIYSVSKTGEKTRQFFFWFDGELTESEMYTIDPETFKIEMPPNTPLPSKFDEMSNIGFARIGFIKETTKTFMEVED